MTGSVSPATAPLRSYRPGSWFAVFGEQIVVLLPPSEKRRVGGLWELVDDGGGFDQVLDLLLAEGLRELPAFVLVATGPDTTRVLLRGPARAAFTTEDGETTEVDAGEAATWVERTLAAVTGMRLTAAPFADDEPDDETPDSGPTGLTIATGLVRVASVEEPPPAAAQPEAEAAAEPSALGWGPGVLPVPPSAAEPEAAPPPWVSPDAEEEGDHDGMTQAGGWDPGEFERKQPGIPGQPPAPSVTARPVARLAFSSGETVEVDRAVLVGRAPEARRFTSTEQPRLVTVPSPHHEISSTHLEIRPGSGVDHGSAVVTDLGSTNGTVVVQPGLPPEELRPGVAVQLIPGAVVDLGDGVTIAVTNP